MISYGTVSYTHLDVYKRQRIHCSAYKLHKRADKAVKGRKAQERVRHQMNKTRQKKKKILIKKRLVKIWMAIILWWRQQDSKSRSNNYGQLVLLVKRITRIFLSLPLVLNRRRNYLYMANKQIERCFLCGRVKDEVNQLSLIHILQLSALSTILYITCTLYYSFDNGKFMVVWYDMILILIAIIALVISFILNKEYGRCLLYTSRCV